MEHSPELKDLAIALVKAQSALKPAVKDATNPFFKSRYADLAAVWDACRDALHQNGLSVIQVPSGYADGVTMLDTMLLHISGQWIKGTAGAPVAKADPQGAGSVLSYLRRYALAAVVGVTTEDDDGNAASKLKETPRKPAVASSDKSAASGQGSAAGSVLLAPVGRHKGQPLKDIDSDGLMGMMEWLKAAKRNPEVVEAIEGILEDRRGE